VSYETTAYWSESKRFIKQVSVRAGISTCNFNPTTSIRLKPFSCRGHECPTDFLLPGSRTYDERCDPSQIAGFVKHRHERTGNEANDQALALRNHYSGRRRAGITFEPIFDGLDRQIVPKLNH
jgi:hypothetical protein